MIEENQIPFTLLPSAPLSDYLGPCVNNQTVCLLLTYFLRTRSCIELAEALVMVIWSTFSSTVRK